MGNGWQDGLSYKARMPRWVEIWILNPNLWSSCSFINKEKPNNPIVPPLIPTSPISLPIHQPFSPLYTTVDFCVCFFFFFFLFCNLLEGERERERLINKIIFYQNDVMLIRLSNPIHLFVLIQPKGSQMDSID